MVYSQEILHVVVANDMMNGMETVWLIPSLSKKKCFIICMYLKA